MTEPLPGPDVPPDPLWSGEWINGPESSLIHSFRFLDARVFDRRHSEIHIRFRDKSQRQSSNRLSTYSYLFSDLDAAEAIAVALQRSPHPFTQVVLPRLIRARVSSRRLD